jgi:hypothetical protein
MITFPQQLRRIRLVADWLDDRQATRDIRKLRETYAPLVAEAEKQKNWNERDRLLEEQHLESNVILHPVYARKGERLTEKVRRYGISVSSEPSSYTDDSEDWYLSNIYGFWLPRPELTQRLQREIQDAQRARYDEFRKWATLVFAIVGPCSHSFQSQRNRRSRTRARKTTTGMTLVSAYSRCPVSPQRRAPPLHVLRFQDRQKNPILRTRTLRRYHSDGIG